MATPIDGFEDVLDGILSDEVEREAWLQELSFLPLEKGFMRTDAFKELSPEHISAYNKLVKWGTQAVEIVAGWKDLLHKGGEEKLKWCIRALYHLEVYLDAETVSRLDDSCKELWMDTAGEGNELNRFVGGLICVLYSHDGRKETDVKATLEWMTASVSSMTVPENEAGSFAKEMLLRNLLALSQALPPGLQERLLLAIGHEPEGSKLSKREASRWRGRLISNPNMSPATWEIIREVTSALGRLCEWRNLFESESQQGVERITQADHVPLVISLHSHKGGVGKTSLALSTGLELASKGLNVCVVDTDFMASSWALILKYKKLNWETFVPIEDYIAAHISTEEKRDPGQLWERMWAEPVGLKYKKGGRLRVALASPFANKRTSLIGHLYSAHAHKIVLAYFDLVTRAKRDGVDCLIMDNSPGLWGFSFVSLRLTISCQGLAIFVSGPDMHDIVGSLLELAAIRDLVNAGSKHFVWAINGIPTGQGGRYTPRDLAGRLSAFPAVDIFENMDLSCRLIQSKFLIVETPTRIEESKAMRRAFLYDSVARLKYIREFSEADGVKQLLEICIQLAQGKPTG